MPALKRKKIEWCLDSVSTANHLSETFESKYKLDPAVNKHYTAIEALHDRRQDRLEEVTVMMT